MQTIPISSPQLINGGGGGRMVYVNRTPVPVINRMSAIPEMTTVPVIAAPQPRHFLQPTVLETAAPPAASMAPISFSVSNSQPKTHYVVYRSPCEKCFNLVPWWCWVLSIVLPLALIIPLIYLSINSLVTDKIAKYLARNFTRVENRTHVKMVPCIPEFIVNLAHLNQSDLKNPLCADNDQNRFYEQVKESNGYVNCAEPLVASNFFIFYFLFMVFLFKLVQLFKEE